MMGGSVSEKVLRGELRLRASCSGTENVTA